MHPIGAFIRAVPAVTAGFAVDLGVLIAGILLMIGVIASGLAARFRVPSLLLFIGLGMLVADDGLGLIRFDDARLAQNVATVALVIILFEGGLATNPSTFRSAGLPAGLLATVGVLITASVVAVAAWLILGVQPITACLLGSVVSSTDAAAVFAALRSEPLPERTRTVLQLESGLNDPVAVLLTVGMVEVWRGEPSAWDWITFLSAQITLGIIVGVAVGVAARLLISRLRGHVVSSISVITLAVAAVSYGAAAAVGGSGFLSVYLTGVVIAGARRSSRSVLLFHEGLAATAQAALFLLLGALVFPSQLVADITSALVLTAALVLIARPLAVGAVLVWSRTPLRRIALISWAGLRGAVPVVLATIPFTAGHPDGALIFDVTFVVVIVSVALQAPTVGTLARRFGVEADQAPTVRPEIVPVDALGADLAELVIPEGSIVTSTTLRDSPLPHGARAVIIRRNDTTVVPTGSTTLEAGDVVLVVTPQDQRLQELAHWCRVRPPA